MTALESVIGRATNEKPEPPAPKAVESPRSWEARFDPSKPGAQKPTSEEIRAHHRASLDGISRVWAASNGKRLAEYIATELAAVLAQPCAPARVFADASGLAHAIDTHVSGKSDAECPNKKQHAKFLFDVVAAARRFGADVLGSPPTPEQRAHAFRQHTAKLERAAREFIHLSNGLIDGLDEDPTSPDVERALLTVSKRVTLLWERLQVSEFPMATPSRSYPSDEWVTRGYAASVSVPGTHARALLDAMYPVLTGVLACQARQRTLQ